MSDHALRCETEGCDWATYAGLPEQAKTDYRDHLRADPRHKVEGVDMTPNEGQRIFVRLKAESPDRLIDPESS